MKVLVKLQFDMNDADYVYGAVIVEKETWERYVEALKKNDEVSLFAIDQDAECDVETYLDECVEVKELTDEEAEILTKFGFDNFGNSFPSAYDEAKDRDIYLDEMEDDEEGEFDD